MLRRSVLALVLLVAAAARADGGLASIRARGKLIVATKNDARRPHKDPAHFEKRGFELELAHAIARRLFGDPSRLEVRILSRPVRLPMLAAGAVDLVISMIPVTADNQRQCDFSHPYFASGLSLLLQKGARPLRLADLAGKTIAFRKQSYNRYGDELERLAGARGVALAVRYFATIDEAAAAVARGEVAAMGGDFVDLDAYRQAHAGFYVDDTLLEARRVAVAVRKGNVELLGLVNATIDELERTGELRRMTQKWHLPYLLPPG